MRLYIMSLKMNIQQKCSQCLKIFVEGRRPYKLTSCPHSICEKCKQEVLKEVQDELICGFCSAPLKKNQIGCLQLAQGIILEQPEENAPTLQENEQNCDLLLIDQDAELVKEGQVEVLCQIHKIHMDIICISDKQRICPHCALFGNHKDHRFRRFQDFQKEISEKIKIFQSISEQKRAYEQKVEVKSEKILSYHINNRKTAIKDEINSIIGTFISQLNILKQSLLLNIEPFFTDLQKFIKDQPYYRKRQNSNNKLKKWEQQCSKTKGKIIESKSLQEKLNNFYNSSLQLAAEGNFFIEQLKFIDESLNEKIITKTNEIKLLIDSQMINLIRRSVRIQKFKTNFESTDSQFFLQQSEDNPFLDCTSSEIGITSISTLRNNSIEVDISNITNSCKIISPELTKTIKKTQSSKPQIKSLKSIDKKQSKVSAVGNKIKTLHSPKNSRVSIIMNKSPGKISINNNPSSKNLLPGMDVKSHQIKQPQKVYTQFSKNTLTDFFDISDCNLPNDKVLQYVYRARKIHRIKGLKLASNHLNSQGFEKMIENLKGVGNINLANNEINETIFEILLRNRDRLDALKIINLSHNPINFQKKIYTKIEDLKKLGIIVIL